jgi:glyoxylase-like metal-dependent hydrolase (beta-lactamase superfamily II)
VHDAADAVPVEVRPFPRSTQEVSAERVMDGIIRLRLPLPYSPIAMVNAFLLERANGASVLVDCGTSIAPGWSALERALDLAGVEPSAIELLVCTHAHADHYGLASEVMERSGCPLALAAGPTASAEVLRDTIVPLEHRLALAQRAGVPEELALAAVSHPGGDGLHPRPAPDLVLDEALELETLAGRWRVVPAPGHSPTQVMLFDDRSRMLLSADLVLAPPIPYAEHDYTPDPWAEHVASLERARALSPTFLLPGHGAPNADVGERIAKALAATAAAEERVHALIATAPRSPWEVVAEILGPDAPFYPRQAGLSGATCLLEHLVRRGLATAADGSDGVRRYDATV